MSEKLYVERVKGGGWALTKGDGKHPPKAVFKSKVDAVVSAWSQAAPQNVVVRNANGQVLQPQKVKTSKPEHIMRNAVLSVVKSRHNGKIVEGKK